MGQLSPADDTRFLIRPAVHRFELFWVDRPDRNPPRMSGLFISPAGSYCSRRQIPAIIHGL
ncbi:hypothetical protein [Methanospirillum purgamenti]|uniref:hypothetical protein n=1 Tax=Methanospirillum purgamenti TaxID=2834276 RepID=UPI002A24C652|nr:hypothetical protein [Methanospirillum hungatei]